MPRAADPIILAEAARAIRRSPTTLRKYLVELGIEPKNGPGRIKTLTPSQLARVRKHSETHGGRWPH